MKKTTVWILIVVGLVLAWASFASGNAAKKESVKKSSATNTPVTADNPEYEKVSEDDSLKVLDKELEETVFEDEDLGDLGL